MMDQVFNILIKIKESPGLMNIQLMGNREFSMGFSQENKAGQTGLADLLLVFCQALLTEQTKRRVNQINDGPGQKGEGIKKLLYGSVSHCYQYGLPGSVGSDDQGSCSDDRGCITQGRRFDPQLALLIFKKVGIHHRPQGINKQVESSGERSTYHNDARVQ
jgi:hypothetical protein